jgi:hypothetical protein
VTNTQLSRQEVPREDNMQQVVAVSAGGSVGLSVLLICACVYRRRRGQVDPDVDPAATA